MCDGEVESEIVAGSIAEADVEVVDIENLGAIAGGDEGAFLVTVSEDEALDEAIAEISRSDGVLYAQPNYIYELMENDLTYTIGAMAVDPSGQAPNDPMLADQYYLEPWQPSETTSGANVLSAWEQAKTEGAVTIAILDSGVLASHEDLKANIDEVHMKDIFNDGPVGEISDISDISHGTHVAGIVAGVANNGQGIAGVSYNARILPLKVFGEEVDPTTSRKSVTSDTSKLVQAFDYLCKLMDKGELDNLHVINMSLGRYDEAIKDTSLEKEIKRMRDDYNVLCVCAGGNGDGTNPYNKRCIPGDFDDALAVTALEKNGTNRKNSDFNFNKDISAPGADIFSTTKNGRSKYGNMSGSSMSTPVVSGIAALLWAYNPDLTVDQVVEAMKATAHPLDPGGANYHGPDETGSVGAIDAREALEYVAGNRIHMDDVSAQSFGDETYTGLEQKPVAKLVYGGTALVEGRDFTATYCGNVSVGKVTVILRGNGRFIGTKRLEFKIKPAPLSKAKVADIAARVYTGEPQAPSPKVTYPRGTGNVTLKKGTDYKVSYKRNIDPGTATVTITGIGNYTGSISKTFTITKPCSVKSLWASQHMTGAVLFKWTKGSSFPHDGWQVTYRTKKIGGTGWSGWTTRSFGKDTYQFKCPVYADHVVEIHAKEKNDGSYSTGIITTPAGGKYQAMKTVYVRQYDAKAKSWKRVDAITIKKGKTVRLKPDYEYPVKDYKKRPRLYPTQALWDLTSQGKAIVSISKPDGSAYTGGMIDGAATIKGKSAGTTNLICRAPNGRTKIIKVTVTK